MPRTVLIVDDHASFRARARRVLEAEGFTVVGEAGDAGSGIAAAAALAPEVVLLDINLPDRSGLDALTEFGGGSAACDVVLISTYDETDVAPAVRRGAARGFIAKAELSGAALRELLAA